MANVLSSHFVNVGPGLGSRIEVKSGDDPLYYHHNNKGETVFQFKYVNERTVLEYIQILKKGKSADPEKILTNNLEHVADGICNLISKTSNRSRLGTFPDR